MPQSPHRRKNDFWPGGDSRAIAVLSFEPEEIARRYGVHFEEDVDDLDRLVFAIITLADGSNALLIKHVGDPNPGTVVRVDARTDLAKARDLLVQRLYLEDGNLLWVAPEAEKHQAAFA